MWVIALVHCLCVTRLCGFNRIPISRRTQGRYGANVWQKPGVCTN